MAKVKLYKISSKLIIVSQEIIVKAFTNRYYTRFGFKLWGAKFVVERIKKDVNFELY